MPSGAYGTPPVDVCDGNPFCSRTLIEVINPCNTATITAGGTATPADYDYQGTLSFTAEEFDVVPPVCDIVYTCDTINGPTGFGDLCSSLDTSTLDFSLTTQDYSVYPPGVYELEITGTVTGDLSTVTQTEVIIITIVDPCDPPTFTAPASGAQVTYFIGEPDLTETFATAFTAAPSFCTKELTFSVADADIEAKITVTTTQFQFAQLDDLTKAGVTGTETYVVTLTWTMGNPLATTLVEDRTLDLIIKNPCFVASKLTWTEPTQTDPPSDVYTGTDVVFTYDPYTVLPAFCEITVSCSGTVSGPTLATTTLPCDDLDSNDQLINNFDDSDYNGGLAPGTYTYTFEVTTNEGQADVTKTFTVDFVLEDPCVVGAAPQLVVTPPVFDDQEYTIGNPAQSGADGYIPSTIFGLNRLVCSVTVTVSAPGLNEDDLIDNGPDNIL